MRIVNRFIQAADRLTGQQVDLKQIFHDAELTEVDHVLHALYVISSRRIDSGHPIQLEEIASAIPDLISDESVLEVAVEISIDGMIATGQRSSAHAEDLSLQLSRLAEARRGSRKLPSPGITAAARGGSRLAEAELPRDFGPPDLDGRYRYELRRVLGSGNQGIVYEAVDRLFTDQDEPVYVALKIFYPSVECCEKGQEGSIARKVRHRNVASVTDQGKTEDGENYVAYELVQGLPLDDWMSKQGTAVQTSEKLRIAIGIARGVQAAHAAGVVHRDLKPSNILIDSDSQPVISDFGIAHTKHRDPTISGRYGTRGSLAFMAPEQFRGELGKSVPLVDVYAIGGILYWMLSKRFPNGDQVAEAVEWLDSRDHGGPQRLSSDFEDSKVRAVLMRSLALDPSERYQSAEALAHQLSCVIDHLPIWGVDDDVWSRAKLFAKRNTLLTIMYAVLILLVGGVVGLILRSAYQQQMMVASMNHASEVEALNRQIEVEQLRSAEYVERMQLARTLFGSWMKTLDAEASESAVLMNLLFLHSQADGNPLIVDPDFKADLIARKVEVAIEHAEGLDEAGSSPIERALWFEMIAGWLQPTQPDRAESYRLRAANLVEQYAPRDTLWLNQLRGGGVPPP